MRYTTDNVLLSYQAGLEKEAATPAVASRWMSSKSPALKRLGHMYAGTVTSKSFERASRDVGSSVHTGLTNFGPGFALATLKGRALQGLGEFGLSKAPAAVSKPLKKLPMYATTFMRNYPAASSLMGMAPKAVGTALGVT